MDRLFETTEKIIRKWVLEEEKKMKGISIAESLRGSIQSKAAPKPNRFRDCLVLESVGFKGKAEAISRDCFVVPSGLLAMTDESQRNLKR